MLEKLENYLKHCRPRKKLFIWFSLFFTSLGTTPLFLYAIWFIYFESSWQNTIYCSWIILLLIAAHELGHLYAAKIMKVPTYGFYFLPVLGATAIVRKEDLTTPLKRYKDYICSVAGPIAGLICIWLIIGLTDLLKLSSPTDALFFWILVSLFNLLPIYSCDGGRMFLDLIAGLNSYRKLSRLVGIIILILITLILLVFGRINLLQMILGIALLWIFYLFILKGGEIYPADQIGKPMNWWQLVAGIVVHLGLFMAYLYSNIWLAGGAK